MRPIFGKIPYKEALKRRPPGKWAGEPHSWRIGAMLEAFGHVEDQKCGSCTCFRPNGCSQFVKRLKRVKAVQWLKAYPACGLFWKLDESIIVGAIRRAMARDKARQSGNHTLFSEEEWAGGDRN